MDCTSGRRLSRSFDYEFDAPSAPGPDGFLEVLKRDGFTYRALGHSDILMRELGGDLGGGGNTTFAAENATNGDTIYGAWTANFGTGHLYACQVD